MMQTSFHDTNSSGPTSYEWNREAHVVQFYTDDNFLLDCLCEFMCSALQQGKPVIIVATEAHRKGLRRRLQDRGLDVPALTRDGAYSAFDASKMLEKFIDDGLPDRRKFMALFGPVIRRAESRANRRRVVVFGEMVAVLWQQKNSNAAILLERLWNELATTHFFQLRCAYPASGFAGDQNREPYATICSEHSTIIPA